MGSASGSFSTRGIRSLVAALAVATLAVAACSGEDEQDVRYEPSPPGVVEAMLEMAHTESSDVLYDLGSGDGRIVIAAARDFGVRDATGVEIDRGLIEESRRNAEEAGVSDGVRFVRADLFSYDFGDADVVTLFLLPDLNIRLRPRLLSELAPGTRVVSHEHDMGEWAPDTHRRIDGHEVYRWTIPARADGSWTWTIEDTRYRLSLDQRFQGISGTLQWGEHLGVVPDTDIEGDRVRFTVPGGADRPQLRFEGRVDGDTLNGTLYRSGNALSVAAQRTE